MPRPANSRPVIRKTSRPPLERMQRIHQALLREDFPNCATLAQRLEVSTKTIQRDINFMRDRQSLPIEFDFVRNGYYYTGPVQSFPVVQVSEGEVLALYVAQKVLAEYQGTRFEEPLATAFEKLTAGLTDSVSFPLAAIDDAISFRISGTAETDLEMFETIHECIAACEEIVIRYKTLKDLEPRARWVQPYHLLGAVKSWYLIGFDREKDDFRVFALPRMAKVERTGQTFSRITDFNPHHLMQGALGIFVGNERHTIRIRFDAFAAQLVRERKWHESQVIRELPNDEIELSLTLNSLFEIERWILSWGVHARVIEPPGLQEQVIAKAKGILAIYGNQPAEQEASLFRWETDATEANEIILKTAGKEPGVDATKHE